MKPILSALLLLSFITSPSQARFEAHEWGTFTSLVGSNGKTQHGMYHEDEKLPDFVHAFGETQSHQPFPVPDQNCQNLKVCFSLDTFSSHTISQKMETPVIYFYSDQQREVSVNVKFPKGIITETYPAPVSSFPSSEEGIEFKNGEATFKVSVLNRIIPDPFSHIPYVEPNNIYGHARNVQSNIVRGGSEYEKFIFYRGLGQFQPQIDITSTEGNLEIQSQVRDLPSDAFLVYVNNEGKGRMLKIIGEGSRIDIEYDKHPQGALAQLEVDKSYIDYIKNSSSVKDHIMEGAKAHNALVKSLVSNGLYGDEAEAMVDTWESGYLKTPGLRILYIVPKPEVETVLPLTLTPQPESVERVFVARIEVMLDTEEKSIVKDVLEQKEDFEITSLGRFAEPKLHRAKQAYRILCLDNFSIFAPCTNEKRELFDKFITESTKQNTLIH